MTRRLASLAAALLTATLMAPAPAHADPTSPATAAVQNPVFLGAGVCGSTSIVIPIHGGKYALSQGPFISSVDSATFHITMSRPDGSPLVSWDVSVSGATPPSSPGSTPVICGNDTQPGIHTLSTTSDWLFTDGTHESFTTPATSTFTVYNQPESRVSRGFVQMAPDRKTKIFKPLVEWSGDEGATWNRVAFLKKAKLQRKDGARWRTIATFVQSDDTDSDPQFLLDPRSRDKYRYIIPKQTDTFPLLGTPVPRAVSKPFTVQPL